MIYGKEKQNFCKRFDRQSNISYQPYDAVDELTMSTASRRECFAEIRKLSPEIAPPAL